jgi:hypothetical protein
VDGSADPRISYDDFQPVAFCQLVLTQGNSVLLPLASVGPPCLPWAKPDSTTGFS